MNATQVQQYLEQGILPDTIRSFGIVPEAVIQEAIRKKQAAAKVSPAVADQVQATVTETTAPVWETSAHEEIDLATVSPEDLGLDPFDFSDPLVKKIYRAQDANDDPYPKFPEALKQSKGFVTWKGDVQYKQPYQSGTTIPASYNNPDHLVTYETAIKNILQGKGYPHIGLAPANGRVAFDIDSCRDPQTGVVKQWAIDFINLFPSTYIEVTPSLTGLRLWALVPSLAEQRITIYKIDPALAAVASKAPQIEVLTTRYATITGVPYLKAPSTVAKLSEQEYAPIKEYLERLAVTPADKKQKTRFELVPGTTRFEAVPVVADPVFQMLFEKVGWLPFEQRVQKMTDSRFHDFSVSDKMTFCPMPQHTPRGPEIPFTSKIFGSYGDGNAVYCFGCQFGGDLVSAVKEFDAGEEGGKIEYANMYECGRAICKEQRLNPEEYFPQKGTTTEPTEEQKKESGEYRLEFSEDTEVIPPFDPTVVNGIYAKLVELMTRGTTLVPQYAFLAAKTYIGLRLAGKVKFATVDAQPRYFGVPIGETGSGKGAAWSRLMGFLNALGLTGSSGVKILNGVDSGAGLKDFFFEPPERDGVLLYVDEAATYANKTTATRNPSALDEVLELVDNTSISRTLSAGRSKKTSKKKDDAHLAMYMCAQDGDVLLRLFAGRGKLGALDRLTPEYSQPVKPGRMPEISATDAMNLFIELEKLIQAVVGKTIEMEPEAETLLETFWESQASTTQTKVRWKKYVQVDAYMSAFGMGRGTVTLEDMQIAIRLFERQLILRRVFFKNMDVGDKVGYYLAKCKVITEWMLAQQAAGKAVWTYAQSKRDYESKTGAYKAHEEAFFDKAWVLHSRGRLSDVKVKKSNGQDYTKYIPQPAEPDE